MPGEDDSHEWTGYVPYDKMPSVYDPPSGIIATANARVTPKDYPYTLAIEWSSPYRVQRIYKLLAAKKQLTAADMLNIQTDVLSEFDRFCAQRFVYAIDHTPGASQRAKAAADLMRNWDGTMATDLPAPTIAYYSRAALEELLLKAKLGDDWKSYRWFMKPVWLENILTQRAATLAAIAILRLQRAADGGGGSGAVAGARAGCALHLEVGKGTQGRCQASVLE